VENIAFGHLRRIDTLRGVAIASVIVFHLYGTAFGYDHPGYNGLWIDFHSRSGSWWLLYPLGFGWVGVCLFFVISGYVIHRSYLLDKHFSWSRYTARRFWRIYPTYIVVLVGFTLWLRISPASSDFVLHSLLIQNFKNSTFFSINGSLWSLAVECQLYAIYPVALWARNRFALGGMLISGSIASAIWMVAAYSSIDLPPTTWNVWLSPIALWPSWLLGSVLAEYHLSRRRLFSNPLWWALAAGILLVIDSFSRLTLPLGFLLGSLVSAALLEVYVLSQKSLRDDWPKPLAALGLCSYSVYLIHGPLISPFLSVLSFVSIRHPALQVAIGSPAFFALVFGAGWILYLVVEKGGIHIGKVMGQKIQVRAPSSATQKFT
jgi:peptidoglycan/LPS O-acetylase OafA/YrhL